MGQTSEDAREFWTTISLHFMVGWVITPGTEDFTGIRYGKVKFYLNNGMVRRLSRDGLQI